MALRTVRAAVSRGPGLYRRAIPVLGHHPVRSRRLRRRGRRCVMGEASLPAPSCVTVTKVHLLRVNRVPAHLQGSAVEEVGQWMQ